LGRDWGPSNAFTWTSTQPATYTLQVWVRNAGSTAPSDAAYTSAPFTTTGTLPLRASALQPSLTSPVVPGTTVTWTATASGGTAPLSYKFYVYNGSSWALGQDWSASAVFPWTPTVPGTYSLQVWVRNAGSTASSDASYTSQAFTVSGVAPLVVTALTPSPAAPVSSGTAVTWTATTTGGVGPLTYKFYVFNGTSWTLARDWSTSPSTTWTPTAAGTYSVQVWVRNAGSTTAYDAVGTKNGFTVTVGSH